MPLDPSLLLGIPLIDREHQALVNSFHKLIDDPAADPTSAHFAEFMSQLATQLAEHFNGEEKLLASCGMPADEVDEHLNAHTEILEQYGQLQIDLMSGRSIDHSATLRMVEDWLVEHIRNYDLRIKRYVGSKS